MLSEPRLHPNIVAAERLGNEIAELSAHIEVAMARLLDEIREFDALGGWGQAPGTRGGLPGRTVARWRIAVPDPERLGDSRGAGATRRGG